MPSFHYLQWITFLKIQFYVNIDLIFQYIYIIVNQFIKLTGITSVAFPFQPKADNGNKPEENQVSNTSSSYFLKKK